jgi:(p)ppGpp synthase/HD superfamily hydrolase
MQDHLKLIEFLDELGAHRTRHSGRTLFDHLKGVHDLLRDWGNDHEVCVAGLFHSIYGTHSFKHQSTADRDKVRSMIGERAEDLAHRFCSATDRPLFASIEDKQRREDLIEIEAANLIEQGSHKALRKLPRKYLSNGARCAIDMELV